MLPRAVSREAAAVLVCAFCLLGAGCGYSSKPLLREDVDTVYVSMFDNQTFRRFHEVELTRAVVDEINQKAYLRIAPKERADSILTGEITDIRPNMILESAENEALSRQIVVYASFTWRDLRTDRVIASAENLSADAIQRVARNETEQDAINRAMREMARKILWHMETDW